MGTYLDFEKPIIELERKIEELKTLSKDSGLETIDKQIQQLEQTVKKNIKAIYTKLTPWQKTGIARHPERPHSKEYIEHMIQDFIPLAGDRNFADDHAIIGGIGQFHNQSVIIIAQEKGNDTESRIKHNFGMARPEGYRKAIRLMKMAEQFKIPIISLIDTPGAYPGIGAEERGQAQAIATAIETCLSINTPIIATIIGEGGSGGAMAIAAADKVLMLEHAIYSVISPEGAAAILWRDAEKASVAATTMKITAQDLIQYNSIDHIIPEPIGGAHRYKEQTIQNVSENIKNALKEVKKIPNEKRLKKRKEKFLEIGRVT